MKPAPCDPVEVNWARYADVYDLMADYNPAYGELHDEVTKRIDGLELPPNCKVVDLGAGTGRYSLSIARAHQEWSVVHVEPDGGMNARARDKIDAAGISNVEIRSSMAGGGLFEPGSVDLCLCVNALYTMPSPREALRWVHRWLRPDGWMVLCDLGQILDVADWRRFVFRHLVSTEGWWKTAGILWRGRQVVRQNVRISRKQERGEYWTHTPAELRAAVEEAGFEVRETVTCYRGYSDLVVARRAS